MISIDSVLGAILGVFVGRFLIALLEYAASRRQRAQLATLSGLLREREEAE
jgi:hypothetical protein